MSPCPPNAMYSLQLHPALVPTQFYVYDPRLSLAPTQDANMQSNWELKTIQLEEVAPPPPRTRNPQSIVTTSTGYTSSAWASTSSAYSSEEEDGQLEGSYCSSDEDEGYDDEEEWCSEEGTKHRVLAWRDSFSRNERPGAAELRESGPLSRTSPDDAPDGQLPQSATLPAASFPDRRTVRLLSPTCCSACDACFTSLIHYRRHGSDRGTPEPCRSAVSYGLECLDASDGRGGEGDAA